MQQHRLIKEKYPDAVLLFRVGDFYETFEQDAIIASQVLGIVLTRRANGAASYVELAGFPYHALDTYLHKLIKAGYRVAICDQLEDPKLAKGVVKRGVTELVTPGIATHDKLLDSRSNTFLAALYLEGDQAGVALCDISTGEFMHASGSVDYMDKLLSGLNPSEIIYSKAQQKDIKRVFNPKCFLYPLEEWIFTQSYAEEQLTRQFQTPSLKGFGIEQIEPSVLAAGAILHYLKNTEHPNLGHLLSIRSLNSHEFLWMDRFTIRNLELFQSNTPSGTTLHQVLNQTSTSMGARLLKRWMLFPLCDKTRIDARLDAVEYLIKDVPLLQVLQKQIRLIGDLERLASKISMGKISPRELRTLATSLQTVDSIRQLLLGSENPLFHQTAESLETCDSNTRRTLEALVEEPPVQVQKGGFIADGILPELDELRTISSNAKSYLQAMQERESAHTGISSLKVGYNNVFGYYLEVTHAHKDKVPDTWIRKQTLANAERYITEELKTFEEKILGAEEKILELELQLFGALQASWLEDITRIQTNASLIAQVDCLACFSLVSSKNIYVRPIIAEGNTLAYKGGRHPVIEKCLPAGESYIANDLELDPRQRQIVILTGPNMSGKSALLRQTALIVLMAHMGCFVPAEEANIGITDKLFTRVGASDNLSEGESTFMVEMLETASILNNLSARSLVILDEIGRGTSTYDGISIAWSIVEYLHEMTPYRPKTLFATHYHELNDLENLLGRVENFHITNKETDNKVVFLRKLAPGGSVHSFGIHVARMAGMPQQLVSRAAELLRDLESKHLQGTSGQYPSGFQVPQQIQLSIFDAQTEAFDEIRKQLEHLDINSMTPVEALLKLQEIKRIIH